MRKDEALKLKKGNTVIVKQNAKEIYPNRTGEWKSLKDKFGEEVDVDGVWPDGTIGVRIGENEGFYLIPHECLTSKNKKPENIEAGDIIENENGSYKMILFSDGFMVCMSEWSSSIKEVKVADSSSFIYSMPEFLNIWESEGYHYADQPQEDMVEIKVEGKTKKISRVNAKELNLI